MNGAAPLAIPARVEERLPLPTVLVYALPATSLGFMGALVSIYLLKYSTDVLLLAPGLMGALLGISRLWDAVSDPMAGYWSDRTRSALGRRRPWLLASALPLALVFTGLWSAPTGLDATALAIWMGAGILLYFTAQTAVGIPHMALGAELTIGYHERSRVFGTRLLFEFMGIFLAAGAIALIENAEDARTTTIGVAAAGAAFGALLIAGTGVFSRERAEHQGRGAVRSLAAFRDVLANPHARLLLAAFFLDQLGFTLLITTVPYANEYVLGGKGLTGGYVGMAIGAGLLFYPLWFPLARRFGKRDPWIAATVVKALAFGAIFFLPAGQSWLLFALIGLIGATQGAGGILAPSIQADVVDYDEHETGQRKEGAYFATWNLATKTAAACAIALAGVVLQLADFQPNKAQSEGAQLAIRSLISAIPAALFLVKAGLLLRFRLDQNEHARIRAALDARAD